MCVLWATSKYCTYHWWQADWTAGNMNNFKPALKEAAQNYISNV